MRNRVISRVVFASVLALVLPSLAAGASPSPAEKVRIAVSYGDLDLHSEAGAKTLYKRVERASKKACGVGSLAELGSLKRVVDAKKCFDYVVDRTVKKIDSDELRKVHVS